MKIGKVRISMPRPARNGLHEKQRLRVKFASRTVGEALKRMRESELIAHLSTLNKSTRGSEKQLRQRLLRCLKLLGLQEMSHYSACRQPDAACCARCLLPLLTRLTQGRVAEFAYLRGLLGEDEEWRKCNPSYLNIRLK